MQLVKQEGKASLYRDEMYNHSTTAKVNWVVKWQQPTGNTVTVRECPTRKEALIYVNWYKD